MLPPHLSPQERLALERFVIGAKRICGDTLRDMRLYGSRARGDGHAESDLDIFVLLSAPSKTTARALDDLAADLCVETGILLDPRTWDEETWATWVAHARALALSIQREGVAL